MFNSVKIIFKYT